MTTVQSYMLLFYTLIDSQKNKIVIPVYKGHSRVPENVAFMSSCPLYTG